MENKINWANEDNAQRPSNFSDENYELLYVKITDIIPFMHSSMVLDINHPKGGDNGIKNRLPMAKDYISSGNPIDYPEIGCNDRNNVIDFTNGRHRTAAAHQLGYEFIPMFVYKETIDKFKSLVTTYPMTDSNVVDFLNNKNSELQPNKNKIKRK